jgi:tRNA A-37 threonylcarbamoyl transferase component Bud32
MDSDKYQIDLSDLASIQALLDQKAARSFLFQGSRDRYFVKRNRPTKTPTVPFLVKGFLGFFGLGYLAPSLNYGGKDSFQYEIDTLRRFKDLGISVPRLMFRGDNYIVLEALDGENVDILMGDGRNRLSVWVAAASEIMSLHQHKLCLSQGFARNIMLVDGRVFFIDFEENPLENMDLAKAQARDWIYFLLSSTWQFDSMDQVLLHWRSLIAVESPSVRNHLTQIAQRMNWLRFLPKKRKPWGRDIMQLQAIGRFLFQWEYANKPET